VLHNVFGRLVAIVFPLHVDRRTGHSDHSQVTGSVWRLLDVQLHQLLVSAVHVACLAHVRPAIVYLYVADLQRSDNFFSKRLLSFCKSKSVKAHELKTDKYKKDLTEPSIPVK